MEFMIFQTVFVLLYLIIIFVSMYEYLTGNDGVFSQYNFFSISPLLMFWFRFKNDTRDSISSSILVEITVFIYVGSHACATT